MQYPSDKIYLQNNYIKYAKISFKQYESGDLMGKKELAENMKSLRLMKGYTVSYVADFVKRAPNTIINWESGKVSPDIDVVEDLCKLYQVRPEVMLGWTESKDLEDFKKENQQIMLELKELSKQKADIEARIKYYTALLDQRK